MALISHSKRTMLFCSVVYSSVLRCLFLMVGILSAVSRNRSVCFHVLCFSVIFCGFMCCLLVKGYAPLFPLTASRLSRELINSVKYAVKLR